MRSRASRDESRVPEQAEPSAREGARKTTVGSPKRAAQLPGGSAVKLAIINQRLGRGGNYECRNGCEATAGPAKMKNEKWGGRGGNYEG